MDLAAKLQLKPGQPVEGVLVPPTVVSELPELDSNGATEHDPALVVFAMDRAVLESHRTAIVESASKDCLTWVAYPKSGQLGTDLNRDSLAALLTQSGLQPVRQVAVDGVWSALRFPTGLIPLRLAATSTCVGTRYREEFEGSSWGRSATKRSLQGRVEPLRLETVVVLF